MTKNLLVCNVLADDLSVCGVKAFIAYEDAMDYAVKMAVEQLGGPGIEVSDEDREDIRNSLSDDSCYTDPDEQWCVNIVRIE